MAANRGVDLADLVSAAVSAAVRGKAARRTVAAVAGAAISAAAAALLKTSKLGGGLCAYSGGVLGKSAVEVEPNEVVKVGRRRRRRKKAPRDVRSGMEIEPSAEADAVSHGCVRAQCSH